MSGSAGVSVKSARIWLVLALPLAACGRVGFERTDDLVFRDGDTVGGGGGANGGDASGGDASGGDASGGDANGTFDPSAACLSTAVSVELVLGHHEDKYAPPLSADKAFDARQATFRIVDERWGIVDLVGGVTDTGVCWVGGDVESAKPWDASWDEHSDLSGPTRNNAAVTPRSYSTTVTGVSVFNVLDAFRTNEAFDWAVEHSWAQYIRSDCVENDGLSSGRVYDVLFDGCYTGISADHDTVDGSSEVIILDRVVVRLEPMPYPASGAVTIDENGDPYTGVGIPYGHSWLFKYPGSDPARSPHFVITNSVFVGTHATLAAYFDFPEDSVIDACEGNTLVWLADTGTWPGSIPSATTFPDCITAILNGVDAETFWRNVVADWHARHPDVGAARKPSVPGDIAFPRQF